MVLPAVTTRAQTPVLDLDFQGDPADTGWGNDPIVTQAGFTAFNMRRLNAVPSGVISTNPSITVGPVTFAITGEVGGYGTAGSGNDDLDYDFMFLGTALGYHDSITWTLSGLAANTSHKLTWYAGLEGGTDRSNPAQATTPAGTSDPSAPIHWWKIDETSGTVVRDWGLTGGMEGTLTQDGTGVGTLSRITPSDSRVGNAIDYTHVSGVSGGYVDAGNVSMSGTFTVNVWVDPNNVDDDYFEIPEVSAANGTLFIVQ